MGITTLPVTSLNPADAWRTLLTTERDSPHELDQPILAVDHVTHEYRKRGVIRTALRDVSFTLRRSQTLAIVGESGAGKSTLTRLIAGLEKPTHGEIKVHGQRPRLGSGVVSPVQMIFQHPAEALNRYASVGASIALPLRRLSKEERDRRVDELMTRVGVDPGRRHSKPSAFSGGQLQRIVAARALAADPDVLLCDEPTSALDVSVQAQIVNLLLELQAAQRFGCVLVTHDLGVARVLAHEVLVLRAGHVVEHTLADQFFDRPQEQYSRDLLAATARQMISRVQHLGAAQA